MDFQARSGGELRELKRKRESCRRLKFVYMEMRMEVEEGEWGWVLRNWAWSSLAWDLVFKDCGVLRRVLARVFGVELEVIGLFTGFLVKCRTVMLVTEEVWPCGFCVSVSAETGPVGDLSF